MSKSNELKKQISSMQKELETLQREEQDARKAEARREEEERLRKIEESRKDFGGTREEILKVFHDIEDEQDPYDDYQTVTEFFFEGPGTTIKVNEKLLFKMHERIGTSDGQMIFTLEDNEGNIISYWSVTFWNSSYDGSEVNIRSLAEVEPREVMVIKYFKKK